MFLQDLLKKIAEIFALQNLKNLVVNSFREIVIIIGALGFITILIIIFVLSGRCGSVIIEDEPTTVFLHDGSNYAGQEFILTPDIFEIPNIESFDVSSDFLEFLPTRHNQPPDIEIINKDRDKIIKAEINNSLLFNFEKRKKWEGQKK